MYQEQRRDLLPKGVVITPSLVVTGPPLNQDTVNNLIPLDSSKNGRYTFVCRPPDPDNKTACEKVF